MKNAEVLFKNSIIIPVISKNMEGERAKTPKNAICFLTLTGSINIIRMHPENKQWRSNMPLLI